MTAFDFTVRTRVVFGEGALAQLGTLARELTFSRTLIVADKGIVAAGIAARAVESLKTAGIISHLFADFDANPDTRMVEAGRLYAASAAIDSIVAVGGGSSLDCAKGINFVLTNGGSMRDYRGHDKALLPMLPSIGVPTTAGTGSDAQSYALISDAETHAKMACGDPKAAFRVAILDPALTVSQPKAVTAVAGYDALSHAVESFVTARRTAMSDVFAREAWRLLEANYERVLAAPRTWRRAARCCSERIGRHRHRTIDARRDPRLRQSVDGAVTARPMALPSPSCCRTSFAGIRSSWENAMGSCWRFPAIRLA